jgi:guanylate kinase
VSRRGIPVVVSAPSGTGKTTLCRALIERDAGMVNSISHTTRPPRAGEEDGVHYHFVSTGEFNELEAGGAFLEWAEYGGNLYGTSGHELDEALDRGTDVLLEIEVQGARQIRERRADALLVFLLPPSLEELERRLRGRGTDADEVVERRLIIARRELEAVSIFDYVVVNDALEAALTAVLEILAAERAGDVAGARSRHGREAVLARLGPHWGVR